MDLVDSLRQGRELGGQLGRYVLREKLGEGANGVVFRAWDPQTEREVAVKLLLRLNTHARRRFDREVRAIARLRHPHVVQLLDSGEDGGRPFLVLELVRGGGLDALAKGKGCDPRVAARWLAQAARAVEQAHWMGILHRDLKPANLLVDERGDVKLVDFGLARLEDQRSALTRTGAAIGTPQFMAPEQVRGEEPDERTDVYGLGATLHYALTGGPPFPDACTETELFAIIQDVVPRPPSARTPGLPAALDAICLRALAKDPDARPSSAGDLAEELEAWLDGRPVSTAGSRSRGRGGSRSRQVLLLALLGVAAGAGGALAVVRALDRREREAARAAAESELGRAESRARERRDAAARELLASLAAAPSRDEEAAWEEALRSSREVLGEDGLAALLVPRLVGADRTVLERCFRALASLAARTDVSRGLLASLEAGTDPVAQAPLFAALAERGGEAGRRLLLPLRRRHGRSSHATELIDRALSSSPPGEAAAPLAVPEDPDALASAAEDLLALGRAAGALDLAGRATAASPGLGRAWLVKGLARGRLGDESGAEADLSRAVELLPTDPEVWLARGAARAKSGAAGAREDLDRALALEPRLGLAWAERGALGIKVDPAQALIDLDRAVELEPRRASFRTRRSQLLLETRRWKEAERDAVTATQLDPDHGMGWLQLSAALARQDEVTRAMAAAEEAVTRIPREARAWNTRGALRSIQGDHRSSLADFERAIELDPKLAKAWANRAVSLISLGEVDAAARDLERALELEPGESGFWSNLGLIHMKRRNWARARELLDRSLALEPDNHESLANRGAVRTEMGDTEGALADLNEALRVVPDDPATLQERARAHWKRGDLPRALEDLQRAQALERGPGDGDRLHMIGLVLREMGRPEEALPYLDRAIGLEPNDSRYLVERARLRRILGDLGRSLEDLAAAIRADPTSGMAWAERGLVRQALGEHAAALLDLERALELRSDHPGIRLARAESLLALARLEPARVELDRLAAERPDLPEVWLVRGLLRAQLPDAPGARADLRQFLELAPVEHGRRPQAEAVLARLGPE